MVNLQMVNIKETFRINCLDSQQGGGGGFGNCGVFRTLVFLENFLIKTQGLLQAEMPLLRSTHGRGMLDTCMYL